MKILKITDGKAGHITVSDGLIEAIKKNYSVEIVECEIKIRMKFFIKILRLILKYHLISTKFISNEYIMKIFYKNFHNIDSKIDLVVSTGGDTQFANVWLSKKLTSENIFCGTLKGVDSKYFSVIISTLNLHVNNSIKLDILPSSVKSNQSSQNVIKFCSQNNIDKNQKYFVLLIGGDGSGYKYSKNDYENLVNTFMETVIKYNAKALITTSRRTGLKNEILLKHLLEKYKNNIAYSVYFVHKAEKVVSTYLELASVIFVSEESGSMISESILFRKPVFTLYPGRYKVTKQYQLFLDSLLERKRINRISINNDLDIIEYDKFIFHYLEKLPIEELSEKLKPFLKEIQ